MIFWGLVGAVFVFNFLALDMHEKKKKKDSKGDLKNILASKISKEHNLALSPKFSKKLIWHIIEQMFPFELGFQNVAGFFIIMFVCLTLFYIGEWRCCMHI